MNGSVKRIALPKNTYGIPTPLRYPGGKSAMAGLLSNIIDDLSEEKAFNRSVTYVEPYAGGAGSAIALLLNNKIDRIVINDYDLAVYAFWHSVINQAQSFMNLINETIISIEEWRKQREIYIDKQKDDLLKLGFAFFYLNRTNRSGIVAGGGPIGGYSQEGTYRLDARYNKSALIRKIEKIATQKDRIILLNEDGRRTFSKYATQKNAFIYLDPPYVEKSSKLYFNSLDTNDHRSLALLANNRNKAKWLITYDNVATISNVYADRNQYTYQLRYSAHNKRDATELMICSDPIVSHIDKYRIN
ncbi:MAG: DNA adenine methylase [Synergistaceae bacterium]|jgi:DNA adenine methylase|nr:DNA adenine methylase [Synergistaceae bacterium]